MKKWLSTPRVLTLISLRDTFSIRVPEGRQ